MAQIRAISIKRSRKRGDNSQFQLLSFCFLPMIMTFIFSYLPMYGIIIAFKDYRYADGIWGSKWVGFRNFEFFLKSNEFVKLTRNTVLLNLLFIVSGIIAAVIVALLLYEVTSRGATKLYQTIMITPNFQSWVIVAYMVYGFLNPSYGILNNFLNSIGIQSIDWYSKPMAWPWILMLASIWKHVGMDCIYYYAALMGIDQTLLEAADIDGATKIQKTRYIILPCLLPLITILTVLKVGKIFNADFGLFYQLTRNVGTLYDVTDVLDTYVFRTMREQGNMSLSSAIGLLQSVVGLVMVILTDRCSKMIDKDLGLF